MWEYLVVTLKGFDATAEAIEKRLNDEGRVGWENYTALAFVVPERNVAQVTLLFKRRKSGIVKA